MDDVITLAPLEQILKYEIAITDDKRVEQKLEMFSVLLEIVPGQEEVGGLTLVHFKTEVFIEDNDCGLKLTYRSFVEQILCLLIMSLQTVFNYVSNACLVYLDWQPLIKFHFQ